LLPIRVPHPPYPARGRKQFIIFLSKEKAAQCPAPSLPRKGTETRSLCSCNSNGGFLRPAPSLPRKGTETTGTSLTRTLTLAVPHPPYPARGRKLHSCLLCGWW